MRLLLPPSETKRDGGDEACPLELSTLGFEALARPRRAALAAVRRLASNRAQMVEALKLSPALSYEVDRNRSLRSSPTMPALDRYTGVLYDALGVATLSPDAAARAAEIIVIHSALFGLLRGGDRIPAYRLSHDSKLPDIRLAALWSGPISRELDSLDGLVVDMRSEGYVGLGPLPAAPNRFFLRVLTDAPDGSRRALNHFNKRGKGEFARAVVQSGIRHPDVDSLLDWASTSGIRLELGAPGELHLIVE